MSKLKAAIEDKTQELTQEDKTSVYRAVAEFAGKYSRSNRGVSTEWMESALAKAKPELHELITDLWSQFLATDNLGSSGQDRL